MNRETSTAKNSFTYGATFFVLLLLWQLLSYIAHIPFIPSPLKVFNNLYAIFLPSICKHLLYSLWRITAGILLSAVVGIPLGLCMGYWKRLDSLLSPAAYFLYPIPKIALLPIAMLVLGLGDTSKIVMIMLIVVFQVLIASRDAVRGIPKETYHAFDSLGAGSLSIFRRIIIPAVLPALFSSVRVSLGTALSVLFFTETFGTNFGMGYFIMDAWMRVNYIEMYSGILVLSVTGLLLFVVIDVLEAVLCPWRNPLPK